MGFMNARRSSSIMPHKPVGPLAASYELERSVENLASAADELRMNFPIEAAEHLWGVAEGAAQALHASGAVHAAVVDTHSPRGNGAAHETEGHGLAGADPERFASPQRQQPPPSLPLHVGVGGSSGGATPRSSDASAPGAALTPTSTDKGTAAMRAARAVAEKTEVKLGSAVAAAMQAVATATAQTRRVASKDVNVPKMIEAAVATAKEQAAIELRMAVSAARGEASREARAKLDRAEEKAKEAAARVRELEVQLVSAQGDVAHLKDELSGQQSERKVGEAVSAAVLRADAHERMRCHADLSELEADLDVARIEMDDALASCATELAGMADRHAEAQRRLHEQIQQLEIALSEAARRAEARATEVEREKVQAEADAQAALAAALERHAEEAAAAQEAAVSAAVLLTTRQLEASAAAALAESLEAARAASRTEAEEARARANEEKQRAVEAAQEEASALANAAAEASSRAMAEAVEQAQAQAERRADLRLEALRSELSAESAAREAAAAAAAREAARSEAVEAATAAARAAAEGSSAQVAEAAAEAARVATLSEMQVASLETKRRHEEELEKKDAEWMEKVAALESANAELERLAELEYTEAEERHRETLARLEEERAEVAAVKMAERKRAAQAERRLVRRASRGAATVAKGATFALKGQWLPRKQGSTRVPASPAAGAGAELQYTGHVQGAQAPGHAPGMAPGGPAGRARPSMDNDQDEVGGQPRCVS